MATLTPRKPYSKEELAKLYPGGLELKLVQVLLRHGERSPVSARFQNAGLAPHWPYCNAAKRMSSVAMTTKDYSSWNDLQWRRRIEKFGEDDEPEIASGPGGEVDAVCQLGELTDKGRETTLALGERLRNLYVHQLGFMPKLISDADMMYLRATPIPRALESVQQAFWGMYPLSARTASFPPPTIITRTPADETLFPNDGNCRRFNQLSRAFAQRTADRWNETKEMDYLNNLISKWMPHGSPRVAVDSHPRLSGIMDTINATLAHGPETRLPSEFYDPKACAIIDRIGVEEWFSGYKENREYRTLGIGGLMGDILERMTANAEGSGRDGIAEVGGENGELGTGRGGEKQIRMALSGCHDTTLAAALTALGAFDGEKWPGYTSHIALELFRKKTPESLPHMLDQKDQYDQWDKSSPSSSEQSSRSGLFSSLFPHSASKSSSSSVSPSISTSQAIGRTPLSRLSPSQLSKLDNYYVRIRYNDKVMYVPNCRKEGNHLEGDQSFCTLKAFKEVVDGFVPVNWKRACGENLDSKESVFKMEEAGY